MKNIHERKSGINALLIIVLMLTFAMNCISQLSDIKWASQGHSYYQLLEYREIIQYDLPGNVPKVIVTKQNLIPQGRIRPAFHPQLCILRRQEEITSFYKHKIGMAYAFERRLLDIGPKNGIT